MFTIDTLFVTKVYRSRLSGRGARRLVEDLARECRAIAADDRAGQRWSRDNGYKGYTSYASLDDLPWRSPVFAELVGHLDGHVAQYADSLAFDLGGRTLELDSLWINVLAPGGVHTSHIHPSSVVSGTLYVETPPGASALKLEDPRLGLMMAAPARRPRLPAAERSFVYLKPASGTLFLWESWLRHEVPMNMGRTDRISVSFNYKLPAT